MPELDGRHALVTGASRGIGAAIANELAHAGARLTLVARGHAALEQFATTLRKQGAEVITCTADLTSAEGVASTFEAAQASLGPVQVLVNNAGAAQSAAFARTDIDLWQHMLAVNLTSAYLCCSQALPSMTTAGFGRVVNVASTAALRGYPYVTAYCAAKHGLLGLTRALALEYATTGITINAVCPGYTDTPMLAAATKRIEATTSHTQESARDLLAASNPQRRLLTPDEVASAVRYLCHPHASGINGIALPIDGGETAA